MKSRLLLLLLLAAAIPSAMAGDKNGWRVNVTKKTLDKNDGNPNSYTREIDRMMALKATFKNISMKDVGESKVECTILVRRWAFEEGQLARYTKSLDLKALKTAEEVELLIGEYHIGGHMHGTSERHVDQLAGWKVSIKQGDHTTDLVSAPTFDSLNSAAQAQ